MAEDKFPLSYLIKLYYTHTRRFMYCDYYQNYRLLVNWLAPSGVYVDVQTPVGWMEDFDAIADVVITYEISELAKILGVPVAIVYYILLDSIVPARLKAKGGLKHASD